MRHAPVEDHYGEESDPDTDGTPEDSYWFIRALYAMSLDGDRPDWFPRQLPYRERK